MDTLPTLYTERLILQPLTLDDAEGIQQQFPHWEVVRYLNALVPWCPGPTRPMVRAVTWNRWSCLPWPRAASGIGRSACARPPGS